MISAIQEACKVYGVNPTPENSLACLMCKDPWVAEYVSRVGTGWMILQVTHQSGITYWVAACLKPANWTKLRKDQGMSNECEKVLYSYSDDGIFGYRRNTLEEAEAFAKKMDYLARRDKWENDNLFGKNFDPAAMKQSVIEAGFVLEDFGSKLNDYHERMRNAQKRSREKKKLISRQNTPEVQE